jgi:hypothetical protein
MAAGETICMIPPATKGTLATSPAVNSPRPTARTKAGRYVSPSPTIPPKATPSLRLARKSRRKGPLAVLLDAAEKTACRAVWRTEAIQNVAIQVERTFWMAARKNQAENLSKNAGAAEEKLGSLRRFAASCYHASGCWSGGRELHRRPNACATPIVACRINSFSIRLRRRLRPLTNPC